MKGAHLSTLPLTDADRTVLARRARLLCTVMTCIYAALSAGLGLYLLMLMVKSAGLQPMTEALLFTLGLAAVVATSHVALAFWERKHLAELRDDLRGDVKIVCAGVLDGLSESESESERGGDGSGPTVFRVRDAASNQVEVFALRTLADLARIQPLAFDGRAVIVEYAPVSRTVLSLQAAEQAPPEHP